LMQDIEVTTTGVGSPIRKSGGNGLAVIGGLSDTKFDSSEAITLDFVLQTLDGIPVTNLQLEVIGIGAKAADGETMTVSTSPGNSATATWTAASGNGRPGSLTGVLELGSEDTLNVQTGPAPAGDQRTVLSTLTFSISDARLDNTDSDGDGLPDRYELENPSLADGSVDSDGDGLTRGQEYIAGTSDEDIDDFPTIGISGNALIFDVKDRRAYRLYKRATLFDPPVLLEDFGAISGNHTVQLPAVGDDDTAFFHLEAYLP
jgi:hypothetical protein